MAREVGIRAGGAEKETGAPCGKWAPRRGLATTWSYAPRPARVGDIEAPDVTLSGGEGGFEGQFAVARVH